VLASDVAASQMILNRPHHCSRVAPETDCKARQTVPYRWLATHVFPIEVYAGASPQAMWIFPLSSMVIRS